MSKIGKLTTKFFDVKKKNLISRRPKTLASQGMNSPVNRILHLQQTIGNQAVQRMMRSDILQTPLKIGQPGDKYEQEADRVAEQVIRMSEPQVQRQEEEEKEEEELLQPKPLVEQMTPLVQRSAEPEDEEEEPVQTKQNSGKTARVPPDLDTQIQSLRGGGQPLPRTVRNFFESRFSYDFSQVRVHNDTRAVDSAQALNARAFTVGPDVVFGAGQYAPETNKGRRLLAHELTHVVQQKRPSRDGNRIQRWLARDHEKLTNELLEKDYKNSFSWRAKSIAANYSGEMDIRGCNYLWYVIPKVPIIGTPYKKSKFYYTLSEYEGPNHGEANLYKYTNKTGKNKERMEKYANNASVKANTSGINDPPLLQLGLALHVAQDRGAHGEGLPGEGHSKQFHNGKKWNPDDLTQNIKGKNKAIQHSNEVIHVFLNNLEPKRKTELSKVIIPEKSALGGVEVSSGVALTKRKPLFYGGVMGYGLLSGERVFGVFSPILSGGMAYYGGEKHMITGKTKVGLRLLRPIPRLYVDVYTGAAYGYNITDKEFIVGISNTIKAKYTGSTVDLGVMFNHLYDIIGKRNILVVGVSASF